MTQLNSGPAPSANRRRRNATASTVSLPAAGRSGPAPAWPLAADIVTRAKLQVAEDKIEDLEARLAEGRSVQAQLTRAKERVAELRVIVNIQHEGELELWRELWQLPQAVQWERLAWLREVAQYVRWKVLGESGDLDAAKEARQLADRLGLTPLSMLRLRWEIADSASGTRATADGIAPGSVTSIASRRSRLG
jgi:hypothetical protein